MRLRDTIGLLLLHGKEHEAEMISCFDISRALGGGWRTDLVFMAAYMVAAFSGLIRPYSEGHYLLSAKGVAERDRRASKR